MRRHTTLPGSCHGSTVNLGAPSQGWATGAHPPTRIISSVSKNQQSSYAQKTSLSPNPWVSLFQTCITSSHTTQDASPLGSPLHNEDQRSGEDGMMETHSTAALAEPPMPSTTQSRSLLFISCHMTVGTKLPGRYRSPQTPS